MGIRIDRISVKDLGPIKKFNESFGMFNLIYSKNERGKTFLTEFIIRSLFRNISRWSYLRSGGKGKVTLTGLDKNPVDFTIGSPKKLEDYWEKSDRGLPPSMAKLLIVKGGEAAIEDNGGVSKFLIKEVLSGINILDKIDSNIQATIKQAKITSGEIEIDNKGEGKKYHFAGNALEKIDNLFEEIESGFAQGVLKTYHMKEKNLLGRLEELERAKKHLAYVISEKIKKLNSELSGIPYDEIADTEKELPLYRSMQNDIQDLEKDLKDASLKSKDYKWLESALSYYRELFSKVSYSPGMLLPVLCGLFSATGIASLTAAIFLFRNASGSTMSLLLGITGLSLLALIIFLIIYFKKTGSFMKQAAQSDELKRIGSEFEKRTGKKLTDIPLLESTIQEQGEYYSKISVLEGRINQIKDKLKDAHFQINQKIINLYGKETAENEWEEVIKKLKAKNSDLKNDADDYKDKRSKLNVNEEDYLAEDTGIEYSSEEHEKIKDELEETREEIKDQEEKIQNLKDRIRDKTGDDPGIGWEELINNLQNKRDEIEKELKDISAGIIAGLAVHKVVGKLHSEEDEKIKEGLSSGVVTGPLKAVTRRYDNLSIINEDLIVSDPYDSFNIKELSTGSVEQVMLALRIGFTSKLLKEDKLFLILDDAFQHSDWDKREIIIDKLAAIAKDGWQIIYLTMDDHIKGLFEKKGIEFKEGNYRSFEL
jgi:uncharacterized protein YhaN